MILDSMGWVEYRSGKLEAALRYLQRAHHLMPDPEIAAHLGEVLWKMGREAEARELWARSLEANPDSDIIRRTQRFSRERHTTLAGCIALLGALTRPGCAWLSRRPHQAVRASAAGQLGGSRPAGSESRRRQLRQF